jgi:hypothetical protein
MLLSVGSAWSQTASVPKAKVDMARASWRKLSQSEVDCVDKALLRLRGSQIWQLIERGTGSDDASVASVRAGCRKEIKTPVARVAVASAPQPGAATVATSAAASAPAKPPVEPAASAMAAVDRKTSGEDTAEFDTAPDKTPGEPAVTIRVTPRTIVTAAVSGSKPAVNEAVAEKASAETVVRVAQAEAARAKAEADQARYEAERATADAIASIASAKWGIGFIQGLVSGPAVLTAGAIVFLLLRRRRQALTATTPDPGNGEGSFNSPAAA